MSKILEYALEQFTVHDDVFKVTVYPRFQPDGAVYWSCDIDCNNVTLVHVCNASSKDEAKAGGIKVIRELQTHLGTICNHLAPSKAYC